jgi:subtilisin family serine protease
MRSQRRRTRPPRPTGLGAGLLAFLLVAGLAPAASAAPAPAAGHATKFIVQLDAPPLAAYTGGIQGYSATSPQATGGRLDLQSPAARRYAALLDARGRQALAQTSTPSESVIHQYRVAFPGFSARLTPVQATDMARIPGVLHVWPADQLAHPLETVPAPGPQAAGPPADGAAFLHLADGIWKRLGGPENAGAGVIVGVIDTGIYPEHPSFADQPETNGRRNYIGGPYAPPKVWNGACEGGEGFAASSCNNKLIGARYFVEAFGRDNVNEGEFLSPRDSNGHGSHTASTAAGNYGVDPTIAGSDLGVDLISGIAPRAYVAVYKVCWTGKNDPANPVVQPVGCSVPDILAAVDRAIADGVDVINFSVGSASSLPVDPLALAFRAASDAGIFVSAAAGNGGPGSQTIGSPAGAPWVTTVAASTMGRTFHATRTVTDLAGTVPPLHIEDAISTGSLPPTPLVDAKRVPAPGVPDTDAELCFPNSLDPAAVAGKAVLCRRGTNPLVEKGQVVQKAGGVGMIIYNTPDNDVVPYWLHWIPAVHVKAADGDRIKAFIASAPEPAMSIVEAPESAPADVLAEFSSRGPQPAIPDIAKPDVTAPGVDILAAATPTPSSPLMRPGETFQVISGTSMATPHVAGAAALLTQLRPTISPAAIKSSLMTTASSGVLTGDGKTPASPFDTGSGRIDPNAAADPGLVLDAGKSDYDAYLKGIDPSLVPEALDPIKAADLNLPAISFGGFLGTESTSRTFTSTDATSSAWRVAVEGVTGIKAELNPTMFNITPGMSQTVALKFTRTGGPWDTYLTGKLVLTDPDGARTVQLPITVEPRRMAVPAQIDIDSPEAAGAHPVQFKAGMDGKILVQAFGLAAPKVTKGHKITAATGKPSPTAGPGVNVQDMTVAVGTQLLGVQILKPAPEALTDLDLYLYRDANANKIFEDTELIAQAATPLGAEFLAVPLPKPGAYRVSVVGFATGPPESTYDFATWTVSDASPDDPANKPGLAVTDDPVVVQAAGQGTFTLKWSDAAADGRYLGLAAYYDTPTAGGEPFATSLVVLDKGPPVANLQGEEPAPGIRIPPPPQVPHPST